MDLKIKCSGEVRTLKVLILYSVIAIRYDTIDLKKVYLKKKNSFFLSIHAKHIYFHKVGHLKGK